MAALHCSSCSHGLGLGLSVAPCSYTLAHSIIPLLAVLPLSLGSSLPSLADQALLFPARRITLLRQASHSSALAGVSLGKLHPEFSPDRYPGSSPSSTKGPRGPWMVPCVLSCEEGLHLQLFPAPYRCCSWAPPSPPRGQRRSPRLDLISPEERNRLKLLPSKAQC